MWNVLFKWLEVIKKSGCSFRDRFHLYCPGCGGTRAFEALLKLHIKESLHYNPLVILLLLDLFIVSILKILERRYPHHTVKYINARIMIHISLLICIISLFLIRNYLLIICNIDLLGDFSS